MNKHQQRKETPVYTGVLQYFPDAINALAQCSKAGNDQHNPNTPLHWDRAKSGDELDAMMRHAMEAGTMDDDGILHSTKTAWRALASLQKELESTGDAPLSEYNEESTWSEGINQDSQDGVFSNGIIDGVRIKDMK